MDAHIAHALTQALEREPQRKIMHRRRPDYPEFHETFLKSERPHILMVTNHGVHGWQVIPGLPDTGGQNVFVNQFSQALSEVGFRLSLVNRGGYAHPRTGETQKGIRYKDASQRILYLEDESEEFVRKEDMGSQLPFLRDDLQQFLTHEGTAVDLIISHYWDGGVLSASWNELQPQPLQHIWIPHSLGRVKKRNVPEHEWTNLRMDERIDAEKTLLTEVDAAAPTSSTIRRSLTEDYGFDGPLPFLPPSVDPQRYHPRELADDDPIWGFLSSRSPLGGDEIRARKIVIEISRTDRTKRKSVLIRAFAQAIRTQPGALLVISIDDHVADLSKELHALISDLGIERHVIVVGSVWEQLPALYAASDIYCTPSVMEGFGMSAQEAAACAVPVVASHLVPFATEYLLGDTVHPLHVGASDATLEQGEGAIVAPADNVEAFATGLDILLRDDRLRHEMGQAAYEITIPAFTWPQRTRTFLESLSIRIPEDYV